MSEKSSYLGSQCPKEESNKDWLSSVMSKQAGLTLGTGACLIALEVALTQVQSGQEQVELLVTAKPWQHRVKCAAACIHLRWYHVCVGNSRSHHTLTHMPLIFKVGRQLTDSVGKLKIIFCKQLIA